MAERPNGPPTCDPPRERQHNAHERAAEKMQARLTYLECLVREIQSALGTEECGSNLVSVARDAHTAEMEWATYQRKHQDQEF